MNAGKNLPLLVGLAIPFLMILFVAASIYLPQLFSHAEPKQDFLYVTGESYPTEHFVVRNGKLEKREIKLPENRPPPREPRLFVHDVSKNESREISFDEAQKFILDSRNQSADGFEVVYGTRGSGFFPLLFWSDTDYQSVYLKGPGKARKMNVVLSAPPHYYYNFRFLGWIVQ